jgi:hypothetical protein
MPLGSVTRWGASLAEWTMIAMTFQIDTELPLVLEPLMADGFARDGRSHAAAAAAQPLRRRMID